MLAYLAMMAPRLMELRRILKPTGSIYLHCDPTASHYLKIKQPVVDRGGQQYPRLQIITVGELLKGQRIKYPSVGYLNVTFKQAPKARVGEAPTQGQLPMVAEPSAPRVPRRPESN